jgi:hypothetical protein
VERSPHRLDLTPQINLAVIVSTLGGTRKISMAERSKSSALSIDNILSTKIDPSSLRFESNMRALADMVAKIRNEEETICEGGGTKAIASGMGRRSCRGRLNRTGPRAYADGDAHRE